MGVRAAGSRREVDDLYALLAVHSLFWLVIGNGVGLLLATLLLAPELGGLLAPFTYGRWMPLHLDLLLYGWCSLPLVGLLFKLYLPAEQGGVMPRLAVQLWSGSLLWGAVSWLAGRSSGKLFLEWSGAARLGLVLSLGFLALALLAGFRRQLAVQRQSGRAARWQRVAKGVLLAGLALVPVVLYLAADPRVYPPINPASGGATGGSLLGSTLGIVAILYLCPFFAGLAPDDGGRIARWTLAVLVLHFTAFGLLDHGDRSHHEPIQVLALASLVIWWPLLLLHLRRFPWPGVDRAWLRACAGWGIFLLATGVIAFLPGVLERWKFTNALVAHAHVAMAGMVTSLNVIILSALTRGTAGDRFFGRPRTFWCWQAGTAILVLSLVTLGTLEGVEPALLFRPALAVDLLYLLRWLGGLLMLLASARWLVCALRGLAPARHQVAVTRAVLPYERPCAN